MKRTTISVLQIALAYIIPIVPQNNLIRQVLSAFTDIVLLKLGLGEVKLLP